jgi:hypothetical protein
MPILGIIASAISGNLWQPDGAYDSLATVTVPSGGLASITFAGIPNTYKHLQVRGIARSTAGGSSVTSVFCSINSSTNADRNHYLYGNGSTTSGGAQVANLIGFAPGTSQTASTFGATILDILDYSSTTKNKTFRSLAGDDVNGGGDIMLNSLLFATTTAISTLTLSLSAGNFAEYSQFSLYGVK